MTYQSNCPLILVVTIPGMSAWIRVRESMQKKSEFNYNKHGGIRQVDAGKAVAELGESRSRWLKPNPAFGIATAQKTRRKTRKLQCE
jgi:hypothetical protein